MQMTGFIGGSWSKVRHLPQFGVTSADGADTPSIVLKRLEKILLSGAICWLRLKKTDYEPLRGLGRVYWGA